MPIGTGISPKEKVRKVKKAERQVDMLELAQQGFRANDLAEHFGVSRRTVDRDFVEILEDYHQQRSALAAHVFDDHLREVEHNIRTLQARASLDLETMRELRAWMQERAKLLGLYPNEAHTDNRVTVQQFYLSFDNAAPTASPPMLPDGTVIEAEYADDEDAPPADER